MAPRDVSQDRTLTPETIERGIATISTLRLGRGMNMRRKSMGICRIGFDESINRLLFFHLGLVLKHLWKRWVLGCALGDRLFAFSFGWHSNEVFFLAFCDILSNIPLSCFSFPFYFFFIFSIFLIKFLLYSIESALIIKSAQRLCSTCHFAHACIYILNDSLGWRKKESRDFVNTEQKGAAKLLVQVLPFPQLVLWLFLITS